jgi:Gpi18-like mannosyltransferase
MAYIKKHLFTIIMLLLLLAAGITCAYALSNYQGGIASSHNNGETRTVQQGERTRPSGTPGQPAIDNGQASTDMGQAPGGQPQNADSAQRQRNRQPDVANQPGGQPTAPDVGQTTAPYGGRGFGGMGSVDSKYAPYLLAYAAAFLAACIAAYFLLLRKKLKIDPAREKILLLSLLGIGLLLRIAAATLVTGHNDINLFKGWATYAATNLLQFYDGARSSDYPPLYIYVLYLAGKIAAIPALSSYYTVLLKLPSIITDIATSYLIYRMVKKHHTLETSVLLSSFYIFNPAVFINSTFWGQADSFFTLIVVAAVSLLSEKRPVPAAVLFAAAVMMKPQGLIFLPVLFFELFRLKSLKTFVQAAAAALVTVAVITLPFSTSKGPLWIYNLFAKTTAEYPFASVNAFNIYSLFKQNYVQDTTALLGLSYHTWGMIFIVAVTLLSWFLYSRGRSERFAPAAALLLITGVFNLSTRMHERYLFPAVALSILAFIYLKDKRLLLLSAGFSATVYLNTHFVLFKAVGMNAFPYSPALVITSIMNVLLFVCLGKVLFDIAVRKKSKPFDVVVKENK